MDSDPADLRGGGLRFCLSKVLKFPGEAGTTLQSSEVLDLPTLLPVIFCGSAALR